MKPAERNENRWFWDAVETKPERGSLDVQGANINFFSWSREGPGLFFSAWSQRSRGMVGFYSTFF